MASMVNSPVRTDFLSPLTTTTPQAAPSTSAKAHHDEDKLTDPVKPFKQDCRRPQPPSKNLEQQQDGFQAERRYG